MKLEDIKWELSCDAPDRGDIDALEAMIGDGLPDEFVSVIMKYDGAYPSVSSFSFAEPHSGERVKAGFGGLLRLKSEEEESILGLLKSPPECFPRGLVPFGYPGNGDLICLDFRQPVQTGEPTVVLWRHEVGAEDPIFLERSFRSFMESLR